MTKEETLREALEGRGCLGKAKPDEPVFVFRAQDELAPEIVRDWADIVATHDPNSSKAHAASKLADEMEAWQEKNGCKMPD